MKVNVDCQIKGFKLVPKNARYNSLAHLYEITWIPETSVRIMDADPTRFPQIGFNFITLQEAQSKEPGSYIGNSIFKLIIPRSYRANTK